MPPLPPSPPLPLATNTVVIAGCPLHNPNGKPYIAAVICFPSGERTFYLKQHLHEGEEVYCTPGCDSGLIDISGTRIALAVCADFTHPSHAATAKRHQLPVLLANHISTTGGWQTCGNSGGWNAAGELAVNANGTQPCLVLCRIHQGAISASVEVMAHLPTKASMID
ncbi:hypothetical protein SAMN04490369_103425 [Vreelandella aquamarina]|uniref:Carbon-nitrogen hydrolase n=1 Tax=Vreelandella aquamarina TaxID=77097 RepID=A0A1H8KTQ7_9GAMM|nr:hypothetical protein SAMN04490369_103425 [Halomonas aquamarina]